MPTNFLSEPLWELTHKVEALIRTDGFLVSLPPRPDKSPKLAGLQTLRSIWKDRLILGAVWPEIQGAAKPKVVVLVERALTERELEFVRRWFENDKLKLSFSEDFQIHPWPPFSQEEDARNYFSELCKTLLPKVLLSLGPGPASRLLEAPASLATLRSGDFPFAGVPLVTTHHPGTLLDLDPAQNEKLNEGKAQVWKDAQRVAGKIRFV